MVHVGVLVSYLLMDILCIVQLFFAAAGVTGAVQGIPRRVHTLCAQIAVGDEAQTGKAEAFYLHVQRATSGAGFQSMGLVIAPSVVISFVYSILAGIITVVSFALTFAKR